MLNCTRLRWDSFNIISVWYIFQARAGEFASSLKGSVLHLLLDAGFLFLLRFSLDDAVDNVMAASVGALRALLVSSDDEVRQLLCPLLWFHSESFTESEWKDKVSNF